MKDIQSIIKTYEAQGRELISRNFAPSTTFEEVSNTFLSLLPESALELQELGKFYEMEMVRCADAKAYFSGCLAGAAMIESFLLFLCILEKSAVTRSKVFQQIKNKNKPYEQLIAHWTLKDLIPLTEELDWVGPDVVDRELIRALVDGYSEMLPMAKPEIKDEEMQAALRLIENRPSLALLSLMQSMRNLIHGGRCLRLRRRLWSEDFVDWSKLVIVLTVEIRDCLILRLKTAYRQYFLDMAANPDGLSELAKIYARFRKA